MKQKILQYFERQEKPTHYSELTKNIDGLSKTDLDQIVASNDFICAFTLDKKGNYSFLATKIFWENFWIEEVRTIIDRVGEDVQLTKIYAEAKNTIRKIVGTEHEVFLDTDKINDLIISHSEIFSIHDVDYSYATDEVVKYKVSGKREIYVFCEEGSSDVYIEKARKELEEDKIEVKKLNSPSIGLIEFDKINEEKKYLEEFIEELLWTSSKRKLPIKNILHQVKFSGKFFHLSINSKVITEIAEQRSDRFTLDVDNDEISLTDNTHYYYSLLSKGKTIFEWRPTKYEIFQKSTKSYIICAFYFTGKTFPLFEAVEYVKIRDLVYLASFENEKQLENFFNFSKIADSELLMNLASILPSENNLKDWMDKNIWVSFKVHPDENYYKKIYRNLLTKYSPVLNLENNPGNLFRYTLEEKVEKFNAWKESNEPVQ